MSTFWSVWIIALTVITMAGSLWLLLGNRKSSRGPEQTTGHSYDGIEEYDNPLPAWWLYLFVISVLFSAVYLVIYPGLGNFPGVLGWTQVGAWEKEIQRAESRFAPLFNRYLDMPVTAVAQDPQALKMGQRLFANSCAQCHGSDARGSFGFPNLTDGHWLYGGSPEAIRHSIAEGRQGQMPAWGPMLGDDTVRALTDHVLALSGQPHNSDRASAGQASFAIYCSACHGADGRGNPLFGAPDLTANAWLYGGSADQIRRSIANGRSGEMPAHKAQLDAARIHLLTAYVYALSQPPARE